MWRHLKTVITFCFSDTFMAHNLYSGFAIQNTFMSTAIIGRMVMQRHPLSAIPLTSLSIFAQLPTLRWNIFLTKALLAFWLIPNWFSRLCNQNGYLNSILMLRWDGHFNVKFCMYILVSSPDGDASTSGPNRQCEKERKHPKQSYPIIPFVWYIGSFQSNCLRVGFVRNAMARVICL